MAKVKIGKVALTLGGAWSQSVSYSKLTYVTHRGDGWISVVASIGVEPSTDETKWKKATDVQSFIEAMQAATAAAVETNITIAAAELLRVQAENSRVTAEQLRATAEGFRVSAEAARAEAEAARVLAESARAEAEAARNTAEQLRVQAEAARESAVSTAVETANAATLAATAAKNAANDAATLANTKAALAAEKAALAAEKAALADEKATLAANAAALANAAAARSPYIGENNHWYVWDNNEQEFVDSGVDASGATTKEDKSNKVTSITDESTDTQYSSARAVWTLVTTSVASAISAVKEWVDGIYARATGNYPDMTTGLAGDIEDWHSATAPIPYTHPHTVDTTGGDISIRSDVQARMESIVPTSNRFKATKLVATGINLLRLTSQTGGISTELSTGVYFPCAPLAFGTYGTAQKNNGLLFTNESGEFLQPTVYMKAIEDGVPTSLTDGVAAVVTTGANGEKFYTNPSALAGKPVYVIVSGITQSTSCAHIAWSGTGVAYDYYVSPTAASDAGTEASLTSALSSIGNNGYLTSCGQKSDRIIYESDTTLRWIKRNGRTQPTWATEEDADNAGTYHHTASISGMESDGAAYLETSGTILSVDGKTVSYSDTSSTATSEYVVYNLATETTGTSAATMRATVQDFGLVLLLDAEGTANLTIAYAQTVKDMARQFFMGGKDTDYEVLVETLNHLYQENIGLKARLFGKIADDEYHQPLMSTTAGAPSAANVPNNWNEETMGVWNGAPRFTGHEYIDMASKKNYRCLCKPTNSTNDWSVLN